MRFATDHTTNKCINCKKDNLAVVYNYGKGNLCRECWEDDKVYVKLHKEDENE